MKYEQNGIEQVWLKNVTNASSASDSRIKSEKKFGIKEDQIILCGNCGNPVTSPAFIITVNDHHRHTFVNPGGITYQISCFSSADGCLIYGEPTSEHTWFQGFEWNYSLCTNCDIHLGWHYQNERESFFGLITDRLIDSSVQ